MIVDTGHLHIGHLGVTAAHLFNNMLHIQQGFMVFCGKANGHHHDRLSPQINEVPHRQISIGLGPLN